MRMGRYKYKMTQKKDISVGYHEKLLKLTIEYMKVDSRPLHRGDYRKGITNMLNQSDRKQVKTFLVD